MKLLNGALLGCAVVLALAGIALAADTGMQGMGGMQGPTLPPEKAEMMKKCSWRLTTPAFDRDFR